MWSSERPPCCPTTVFLKQGATRWLYRFLGWRGSRTVDTCSARDCGPAYAGMGTVLGRTCQLTSWHGHSPWTYMSAHQLAWAVLGTYLPAHSWHSPRKVRAIARAGMGIVLGIYVPTCSWHRHSPWNVRASQSAGMGIILGTYVPTCSWHGHSPRKVRVSQSASMDIVLGTYVATCSWHEHSLWNVRANQSAGMGIVLGTYVATLAGMGIVLGTFVQANQLVWA